VKNENIRRCFNLPSVMEAEETQLGLKLQRFAQKDQQTNQYSSALFTEINLKEKEPTKQPTHLVFVFYGILNHHLNSAVRHYGINLKKLLELSQQDDHKKIKLIGLEYQFGLDDPNETAKSIISLIKSQNQPLPKISFYGISFGGAYAIHCTPILESQGIEVNSLILQCSPLEENDLFPKASALFPSITASEELSKLMRKKKRLNYNQALVRAMGLLDQKQRVEIVNSPDGILANLAAADRTRNMAAWRIPKKLPSKILYIGTSDDEVVNQERVLEKLRKIKGIDLEIKQFESQPGMNGHGIREKLLTSVGEDIFQFL